VHYVIPVEIPEYWISIVEKHQIRHQILDNILSSLQKNKRKIKTAEEREKVFQCLEKCTNEYLDLTTKF